MRHHLLIIALSLSLAASLAIAQQQDEQQATSPQTPSTESAISSTNPDISMQAVIQQKIQEIQAHWDKMSKTQDPDERQKLMAEHRQKMHEFAEMMRELQADSGGMEREGQGKGVTAHGGMMGHDHGMMSQGHGMIGHEHDMMDQGMGMMGHGKKGGCPAMRQHEQIERRLETIQRLLEQVLEYQIRS